VLSCVVRLGSNLTAIDVDCPLRLFVLAHRLLVCKVKQPANTERVMNDMSGN
jgi:hypothetical protein